MRNKNKKWRSILVIGIITFFLIVVDDQNSFSKFFYGIQNRLTLGKSAPTPSSTRYKILYDFNTSLYSLQISQMKEFNIRPYEYTKEMARQYAKKFHMDASSLQEKEDYYFLENKEAELLIYKKTGLLQYKKKDIKNIDILQDTLLSKNEILKKAIWFIKDKDLPFTYAKALIQHDPDTRQYYIWFINTIEGFYNYSSMPKVITDEQGNIIQLNDYQVQYVSNGNSPIKTIEEAYKEMKDLYSYSEVEGLQVDIQNVELVYIESEAASKKVQPAYRFSGETNQETSFEQFIPAFY